MKQLPVKLKQALPILGLACLAYIATLSILPASLRTIVGIAFLILISLKAGETFFSHLRQEISVVLGMLCVLSYIIILGSLFFYSASLPAGLMQVIIVTSPLILLFFIRTKTNIREKTATTLHTSTLTHMLRMGYCILTLGIILILIKSRLSASVQSPWPYLPPLIFGMYFASAVAIITLAFKDAAFRFWYYIPLSIASFGVTTLMFPLGFGFDPFIHQATEKLLLTTGTISPKPLYYVGYYTLIGTLSTIIPLPVDLLDRFALLTLASVTLPLIIGGSVRYIMRDNKIANLAPFAVFIIPFAERIQSTPYAISLIWSFALSWIGILYLRTILIPTWILILLTVSTLLLHPLSGIPCAFFTGFCILLKHFKTKKIRRALGATLFFAGAFAIPISLYSAGYYSPQLHVAVGLNTADIIEHAPLWIRFIRLDDLVYTFGNVIPLILASFLVLGILEYRRHKQDLSIQAPLLTAAMLTISALIILLFLNFNFPTGEEQRTFALRQVSLALYFLFPLITAGLIFVGMRAVKSSRISKIIFIILISGASTIVWYLSYPRFDTRVQFKGFTASEGDYRAVRWIYEDSTAIKSVVLANQTVSGVALKEFGFAPVYNDLFWYPIPTNSPLYPLFLQSMSPENSMDQINKNVIQLTGAQRVYVVLNNYWEQADAIFENHRSQAHRTISFPNGVTVFTYEGR